jgi:Cu-processing system permease protein
LKQFMRKILGIARYTFVEIFRNKVYYTLLLFAGVLVLSTLLLGALGGEQKNRMILDLGLAGIEIFALVSAVFAAVTLVLEEMESRTLYLVLTRPVARSQFVVGRYLGLVAILTCTILLMAAAHLALLKWIHVPIDKMYALSVLYSWEKIVVVAALALVFSLFSTSTVSAVTFTLFFWVMGHFSAEILFLAQKASPPLLTVFCDVFYYLAPNFQIMNLRDLPPDITNAKWLWAAGGYGLTYTGVCLGLTALLFRKKEF